MPTSLNKAIQSILKRISTGDRLDVMKMTEEEFTVGSHFSFGATIKDDLGLWKENSPLASWFTEEGVSDPDDMSDIILTCVYRIIMAKDVDLEGQMSKFKE